MSASLPKRIAPPPHWRLILREPFARTGLVITLAVIVFALAGSWFSPHSPHALLGTVYGAPERAALLGYDYIGQDVLSRVFCGGRSVVWMAAGSVVLALLSGVGLGLLAGFHRGWIDQVVVWWMDVLHAFPHLILVLLVVSMLGRDPGLIVGVTALAFVPGVVRLVRGLTLGVVNQEFIEAARLMGYSRRSVLFVEILPNIVPALLIHAGTMLSWAVGILAGLNFLGYGVAAPAADWGLMINENRTGLLIQPWGATIPAILIALFALGSNLLAEGAARASSRLEEQG
ncbi:MAG: ABC transporter permease [Zoogloeaceae bacterium]|jgi:peptide/nickel transport system permease protein|nr:ABC transporter permease [Zoogloeaceae bacterium]